MRVLVTGGAGYIGSHAASLLLEEGWEVLIYDDLSTGVRAAVPKGAEFIYGDIRDEALLCRVMRDRQVHAVMHFAAKLVVSESVGVPLDYYDTNVVGGLRVIQACLSAGVRNLIFSSTAAVYGESDFTVPEDSATAPINPYGASKLMVEKILQDIAFVRPELRWVILRYFNVAGAAMNGSNGQRTENATHLVKVAAETAVGKRPEMSVFGADYPTDDGTCVRDYIHVEDLVSAHVSALKGLESGRVQNSILNCGYGRGASVMQVVNCMKAVSGNDFPIKMVSRRPGDPARIVADATKIRRVLEWEPRYDSLELICRSAYDWESRLQSEV